MMITARLTILLLACLSAHVLAATGDDELQAFFSDLHTLSADFSQHVVDSNNKSLQRSSGRVWIRRPGMFRWDYLEPYQQQIVADGEKLWTWDRDLEQVTVQAVAEVLTATPAMLLGGGRPITDVFNVESLDAERVRLLPKTDDSNVVELLLEFSGGLLARISAQDTFGNTTHFSFSKMQRNPQLAVELFSFEPPPGADVVGGGNSFHWRRGLAATGRPHAAAPT